jgi:hypothetical protein
MRSPWLVVALGALLSASTACSPPPQAPTVEAAPPDAHDVRSATPASELPPIVAASGIVLMRPDAMVLDAPKEGATASELAPYGALQHLYALQAAHPARVVGRAGRYYAIATGEPLEGTCYPEHTWLFSGISLTVFVHEDDLFPVLTRPLERKVDGTLVKLDPGVALGPPSRRGGDAHLRDVGAAPLLLSLLVPDDAVGFSYQGGKQGKAPSAGKADAQLMGTCENKYDCHLWMGGDAAGHISGPGTIQVRRIERQGERTLVSVTGACVEVHATVNERALRPLPESNVGYGYGTACGGFTRDDYVVRPGAKAYWPDGRVAGALGPKRMWMHKILSDQVGGRRCFKRHPTAKASCGGEKKYLRVCFEESDVGLIGDQ